MYPASITSTEIEVTRDETVIELALASRSYYGSAQANVYICQSGDVISYETNTTARFRTIFADGTDETSETGTTSYTVPENAIYVGIII